MSEFLSARQKIGGIKGVMRALGDAPEFEHHWKNLPRCPFCQGKSKSAVWNKYGADFFTCHAPGCVGTLTEVSYIKERLNLSTEGPAGGGASPAYQKFLELAGCWEEKRQPAEGIKLEEAMVQSAKQLVLEQKSTSLRTLQSGLKVGAATAIALLDALELLGVVGPARTKAPREILIGNLPPESVPGGEPIVLKDLKDLPPLGGGPAVGQLCDGTAPSPDNSSGGTPPPAAPATGDGQPLAGIKEPGSADPDPAKLPAGMSVQASSGVSNGGVTPSESAPVANPSPAPTAAGEEVLPLGLKSMRAFYSRLAFTDQEMKAVLPGNEPVPNPLPGAVAKRLQFAPIPIFGKRGITTVTCRMMGLRANPRGNEAILYDLLDEFGWDEMAASGLWLEPDRRRKLDRRVNTQFCGKGQVGRKPDTERRTLPNGKVDHDDKAVWGWCQPVLIPYFDPMGKLIKLRPHKGNAPSGTVSGSEHIYVPRPFEICADMVEKFYTVVVCEGEYKAIAIWQTIGVGANYQGLTGLGREEAVGVCALPGISFVKNLTMRDELEEWLRDVGCKRVIVAFDDEDKSDKPLRQRFDAQIYARVLATHLGRALGIVGLVCPLPKEWRNSKGKADWDGALAQLLVEPAEEPSF